MCSKLKLNYFAEETQKQILVENETDPQNCYLQMNNNLNYKYICNATIHELQYGKLECQTTVVNFVT